MMRRLILLLMMCFPSMIWAELPPSAYERMQAAATDVAQIQVLRVEIEPGDAERTQNVQVMALVDKVDRSTSGLKEGDILNFHYTVTNHEKGWGGPGEIPILQEKEKTVAYLLKDSSADSFRPAAGAMSFRNF